MGVGWGKAGIPTGGLGGVMGIFVFGCVIGLIIAFATLTGMRRELTELRDTIARLSGELAALKQSRVAPEKTEKPVQAPSPEPMVPEPVVPEPVVQEPVEAVAPAILTAPLVEEPQAPLRAAAPPPEKQPSDFEQQFGGRAFVWIGGVALALAGFFLVKYSIEMGLLDEKFRILIGLFFGAGLIAGSGLVRAAKNLADGTRIAQALAGAGIADLYGCLFAATTLYHLIPPWAGFAAMAAVTALALVLSLRFGSPIAVLGLIGGYATPLLIQGEPNAPLLFGYLYICCAGLMGIARGRGWWWLAIPTIIFAYGWVALWIELGHGASDAFTLSLFLIAVGITAAVADHRSEDENDLDNLRLFARNLPPIASLLLMGALTFTANFSLFEWAMYGILSLWALLLARFDTKSFAGIPWFAMVANLVMLASWKDADPSLLQSAGVIGGFAALFIIGSQILIWRSPYPLSWAATGAVAAIGYLLLAYCKLDWLVGQAIGKQGAEYLWSAVALAGAVWFAAMMALHQRLCPQAHQNHILQAIYTAAATALVSFALVILLEGHYLAMAAAGEIFALSLIARVLNLPSLRPIAKVLTAVFVLVALPNLEAVFFTVTSQGWAEELLNLAARFLLPAGLLALAAGNWRRQEEGHYGNLLDVLAVLLVAGAIQRGVAIGFPDHPPQLGLLVTAVLTNTLLVWAALLADIAGRSERRGIAVGALLVAIFAGKLMVVQHLTLFNPLLSHQWVGDIPFANGVLFAFALPGLLFYGATKALPWEPAQIAGKIAAWGLMILSVVLLVRQLFHGAYLDSGGAGNTEVYGYSVAGLVLGIVLLLTGVARRDGVMRIASLLVMLATVGKVFLYDASALTGLLRVVSFLGLGFSLLGLSWFYSRFVFKKGR